MPDVGAALRGRTFGLPNGILLVAVAAGIWWFFIRGKTGKAAATQQAAAAGSQLESGYGLGFAQGQQAAQANQTPPLTGPPPPSGPPPAPKQTVTAGSSNPYLQGPPYFGGAIPMYVPSGPPNNYVIRGVIPWGTVLTVAGPPVQGTFPAGGGQTQTGSAIPVQFLGGTVYVGAGDISNVTGGQGGPSPRKHAIGSRSSHLFHDGHPLIGAPVKYAHYVRVGGPKSAAHHAANINHVAQQAGVHPARVAMLNPVPTALIRIA